MPIATDAFTALSLLVSTLYTFQNLIRYGKAADWNGVMGILLAIAAGIATVALAAHSDVTSALHLIKGSVDLGHIDGGSIVMLGIAVGSVGPVLSDVVSAIDSSRSSAKPKLINSVPKAA